MVDDIIHDVRRRVIHTAGLSDLRLVLHLGLVPGGEADDLAQELLVDLTEDVGADHGEGIRAIGIVQALEDLHQHLVV